MFHVFVKHYVHSIPLATIDRRNIKFKLGGEMEWLREGRGRCSHIIP